MTSHETMFTFTPPPSEFDEVDKTALLSCSPVLTAFTSYPSPAPSHEPPSDSIIDIPQEEMSFAESQRAGSHDIFFQDASAASFLPISSISEQDMAQYTTSSNAFPLFQPTSWLPYAHYPHQQQLNSYEQSSSSSYPAFDTSMPPSYNNIIVPPTPQDIAPASFDFNTLPNGTAHHQHLSPSPSFSHQSSHQSSLSSLSRSPSPTLYQMGDNATPSMRQTLRSNSTSSNSSLHSYGIPVADTSSGAQQPAWRCAYPGCTSRATFTRGCDLRKHYNRHSKHLFCRVDNCPQSQAAAASRSTDGSLTGGFSSKKDRARHEAKHNPGIKCEWRGPGGEDCGRIFSRMDNMKDHVRRIHKKQEQKASRS